MLVFLRPDTQGKITAEVGEALALLEKSGVAAAIFAPPGCLPYCEWCSNSLAGEKRGCTLSMQTNDFVVACPGYYHKIIFQGGDDDGR